MDFRRVDLTNPDRGGILSHASVLTVTSYPDANFRRDPRPDTFSTTFWTRLLRRRRPTSRHSMKRAAGRNAISARTDGTAPLESELRRSATPRWIPWGSRSRTTTLSENGARRTASFSIDTEGTLPDGTRFTGPSDLRDALATRIPQFAEALTRKNDGLRSGPRSGILMTAEASMSIMRNWETKGYAFQSLVFEIVHSLPFQSRRGER